MCSSCDITTVIQVPCFSNYARSDTVTETLSCFGRGNNLHFWLRSLSYQVKRKNFEGIAWEFVMGFEVVLASCLLFPMLVTGKLRESLFWSACSGPYYRDLASLFTANAKRQTAGCCLS